METIIYAKKTGHPLVVTIMGRDDSPRTFKMSAKELMKSIRRHCAFYGAVKVSEIHGEYEDTIRLSNGMEFNVMLY